MSKTPRTDGCVDQRKMLEALFGPDVVVAAATPSLVNDKLYPDELAHIERAARQRRAEFGTARVLAREALTQLGVAPVSLVPNPDRSPRWPPGVTGTISHTSGLCAVAVTKMMGIIGLGLDIENNEPLPEDIEPIICTADERDWLFQFKLSDRATIGRLIFSVKEALYKSQYAVTKEYFDFLDVSVGIDLDENRFWLRHFKYHDRRWKFLNQAEGRFIVSEEYIMASMILNSR